MNTKKTALVLEGGGFRGMYSAGILDYFLENRIRFPYTIGVSMGACNASSYTSEQHGRNLAVPYQYVNDRRYISYKRFFLTGELFGMNFIFNEIPTKHIPFDFDAFNLSKQKVVVVATNCYTGEAEYFSDFEKYYLMDVLKASTSLPFTSKMVEIDGKLYLDGGIADSIPFKKALSDGNNRAVVILTQPAGYIKKPMKFSSQIRMFYRKFPMLAEKIIRRNEFYNNSLAELEQLESEKKIFVIRPDEKLPIERVERNRNNLKKCYDIGYAQCTEFIGKLEKFLG